MRIPGGDLAPARRRRYGGSYGRRHRRNQRVAVVVGVLLIAGGGVYLLRRDDAAAPPSRAATPTPTCSPTAVPATTAATRATALPKPAQVRITLLNGTARNGLAKQVADQLAARGFTVPTQGNSSAALGGASVVAYGPGGLAAATLVQHHVLGSRLASSPRSPRASVTVTLGGDFRRLATPAEAAAAARTTAPTSSPAPRASCAA